MRPLLLLLALAGRALADLVYQLPPDKYTQAIAYNRALDWAYFLGTAGELIVLAAMVRWHIGARLRDFAQRITKRRFFHGLIVAPAVIVIVRLLLLPLSIHRQRLAVEYQQSVQAWPSWFADWAKELGLEILIISLGAWLLFGLIRRSPRRWWLYAWLLSLPIGAFIALISPLALEPMFYRFDPLEATRPDLVAAVEKVAAVAGYKIQPDRVFEMHAAQKENAVNAYMTGFGPSRRIVIWDTTIAALTPEQIQDVFAHELGHYALNHVPQSIALGSLLLLLGLIAADRLLRAIIARYGPQLRIRGLEDWAVLPLAFAVLVLFSFLSDPLVNGYSRWQERQADIYELEVMHTLVLNAGRLSAEVDQIMGRIDLDDPAPNPFFEFWLYTHPSTPDRMHFAQHYNPWVSGHHPRYVN